MPPGSLDEKVRRQIGQALPVDGTCCGRRVTRNERCWKSNRGECGRQLLAPFSIVIKDERLVEGERVQELK